MLTRGIPPDFLGGVHLFIPPYVIGSVPSLSSHAILRTDDVHYLESASTGPVVLKVVPVMGAAFAGPHGPINVLFSFPHIHYWCVMGIFIYVESNGGIQHRRPRLRSCVYSRRGCRSPPAIFSVEQRARSRTKRTRSYTSGGTSTTMSTCPSRSTGAYATHGAASGSTPLKY